MIENSKKFLTLPSGESLAYLECGAGHEVFVLVHGNMSSSVHFEPIIKGLPVGYKSYAPDLRGFGDSSYLRPIEGIEDFADDLHHFISALDLKDFTLVGWSTGGGVCMAYDLKYPGRAKKMVLLETVSCQGYPILQKDEQGQPIDGAVYGNKAEMGTDPIQVQPAVEAMEAKNFDFLHTIWDMAIYSVNKPSEHDNRRYLSETLKQRNLLDVDWALATFNLSDHHNGYTQGNGSVKNIEIPVLAMWGEKDYVVLEHMVTETVEAIGTNAIYEKLSDSGHSPLIDCPELLVSRICQFVQEDHHG